MNAIAFDTLAFAKRLQEAGVPVKQAEAQATAQADFLTHHLLSEVATKADIQALETATKSDIQALRVDIQALETATKSDIQALRVDMKAGQDKMESKLEASLAKLETKLTMRMLLMVGALATLMTVLKFIS